MPRVDTRLFAILSLLLALSLALPRLFPMFRVNTSKSLTRPPPQLPSTPPPPTPPLSLQSVFSLIRDRYNIIHTVGVILQGVVCVCARTLQRKMGEPQPFFPTPSPSFPFLPLLSTPKNPRILSTTLRPIFYLRPTNKHVDAHSFIFLRHAASQQLLSSLSPSRCC